MKVKIGKYTNHSTRKVKIKFNNQDFYSLDHTLALIIAPALKEFKKHKAGIPSFCLSELHWELTSLLKKTKTQQKQIKREEKIAEKMWNDIVDAMIWSFETIIADETFTGSREERLEHEAKVAHGLECFSKYYGALWT